MARKNFKNIFSFSLLILTLMGGVVLLFTACDSPMGLGKPIDFEPPVLKLDPIPTPLYVRGDTTISGEVTDNIAVDRVILRDSVTQKTVTTAAMPDGRALITGNRWEMKLDFDESRNGEKLTLDIVAFDKMGNSGDTSIKTITIIIDIGPPITEDMIIQRTDTRTAFFESFHGLEEIAVYDGKVYKENWNRDLTDNLKNRVANVNRFQNGVFTVIGTISEEETRINNVTLNIYDAIKDIDLPLLKLERIPDSSAFKPRWLVDEQEILKAGEAQWPGYINDYEAGENYIYRVAIEAYDKSLNENFPMWTCSKGHKENKTMFCKICNEEWVQIPIIEEEGYFLMAEKADVPKGNLDPIVGGTVTRGGTIPVEFFDDDTLDWAYAGLLTSDQWDGTEEINTGVKIPVGISDDQKLAFLQEKLLAKETIYNWRFHKYSGNSAQAEKEPISELIEGKKVEEKIVYLQSGNTENDYGAFVLFTLVKDKKLAPHPTEPSAGSRDTYIPRTMGRKYNIDVIDENAPLIVLDVINGCPEENTFPTLSGGQNFTIKGYTLRENSNGVNGVIRLRMAWIPSGKTGGSDKYIPAVQTALRANNYKDIFASGKITLNPDTVNETIVDISGIQYWDFNFSDVDDPGFNNLEINYNNTAIPQEKIGESYYRNQTFSRNFNILGSTVDSNTGWRDFYYNGSLENENKLFIIYAECNMGHQVYRQMRLLGNKTPPNLYVYDITGKILDNEVPATIPDIKGFGDGTGNAEYDAALKTYNERNDVYTVLEGASIDSLGRLILEPRERAIPFQMYTWGTILKYWVNALPNGDLAVKEIRMKDITSETVCTCPEKAGNEEAQKNCNICAKHVGSAYKSQYNALTFIEKYPDEAQRVFLFEAEDTLGNVARMQRTVAVTNAARLERITTDSLNDTYGIGKEIILQADFSGQIKVEKGASAQRPRLNIRYKVKMPSDTVERYQIDSLAAYITVHDNAASDYDSSFFDKETLFLKFRFVVPQWAVTDGLLETMYEGQGGSSSITAHTDRPISLLGDTRIIDINREQHAFIPGYIIGNASMPNWITANGSLQENKTIKLDGIRPLVTGVAISGNSGSKNANPSGSNNYYFRNGETIELTINSDKPIQNSDIPHLAFSVRNLTDTGTNLMESSTIFAYSRQGNANQLIFSLPVSSLTADGQIKTITYVTGATGKITDRVGNELNHTVNLKDFTTALTAMNLYIKRTIPSMPAVTLTNTSPSLNTPLNSAVSTYNHGFTMTVTASAVAFEDKTQYSKDGGLNWTDALTTNDFPNGTYNLRARYVDLAGNEGYQRHRCTDTTSTANTIACAETRNYSCAGTIQINSTFPNLNGITIGQSTGWFTSNTGQNEITVNLSFDEQVRVATSGNTTVTVTLRNRNTADNGAALTSSSAIQLTAAAGQTNLSTSIQFNWTGITGKEMRDGLYVSEVVLTGLRDAYGNSGGTSGTVAYTGAAETGTAANIGAGGIGGTSGCPNIPQGYKVDSIAPTVSTRVPAHQGVGTDNTKITLTFNENVMKGVGTITIRPRGNYSIPPVFEDEGYYLDVNGTTRYATPGTDRTYIPSLGDVYNKLTSVTDRNALAQGTTATNHTSTNGTTYAANGIPFYLLDSTNPSLSRLRLNTRTGQSAGPYIKMTQGLIDGRGYTGNYAATLDENNPNPATGYMIPDLATKWVLDYQYNISSTTGAVANIRTALNNAKFRWQELDVVVNTSISGSVVTINLSEPLLRGLEWDVTYPAGTFTDMAGNEAVAVAANGYNFSSAGVQPPVIRVNRRSYDGKNANWHSNTNSQQIFNNPTSTGTWDATTTTFGDVGWSVASFNTVHYKVETESQGATVSVGVHEGTAGNNGAATGAWTGNVHAANSGATTTNYTDRAWDAAYNSNATAGTFVLPNIIRRAGATQSYNVLTVNGTREDRRGRDSYAGYRSYNRDFTATELNTISLTAQTNGYQGILSYSALQASKSYIAASAVKNGATVKGYEGVFRTVIALLYGSNRNNSYIAIEGSNLKNGMPSVAGFPVRDAEETGDNRFVKAFFNVNARTGTITDNGTQGGTQFYWVSTEIVTEWYFLSWGGGQNNNRNGSHQMAGEVDNYLTVGYGDLTFGYNTARYGTGGAVTW